MDELEDQPSFYRKPLLILASLFLLFLVVSFTFADTIQGIIQSKKVESNMLDFSNSSIVFLNTTLEQLQKEYLSNPEREIKACLFGSSANLPANLRSSRPQSAQINKSLYNIDRVEFPEVVRANVVHIVAVQCPEDVLIDLHSHPVNKCLASSQDIVAYNALKSKNKDLKMLIMCSRVRFALV